MSDNIFEDDQSSPPVVAPTVDTLPPELVEFVGEGKKYRTAADALRSIPHAQTHIQKLENELKERNELLIKTKAMEDLLAEIKQQSQGQSSPVPPVQSETHSAPVDIASEVEAVLTRKQAENVAKHNAQTVSDAFRHAYGDSAWQRSQLACGLRRLLLH